MALNTCTFQATGKTLVTIYAAQVKVGLEKSMMVKPISQKKSSTAVASTLVIDLLTLLETYVVQGYLVHGTKTVFEQYDDLKGNINQNTASGTFTWRDRAITSAFINKAELTDNISEGTDSSGNRVVAKLPITMTVVVGTLR